MSDKEEFITDDDSSSDYKPSESETDSEEEKSFVNGLDSKVWIDRIDKAVEEFYFVCPPEYSNLKFEVINIKIRC